MKLLIKQIVLTLVLGVAAMWFISNVSVSAETVHSVLVQKAHK